MLKAVLEKQEGGVSESSLQVRVKTPLCAAVSCLPAADGFYPGQGDLRIECGLSRKGTVYLDIASWKTLPKRQIISGLAETIKHACLADAEFFDYLNRHMDEILALEPAACEHIAYFCRYHQGEGRRAVHAPGRPHYK